MKKKRLKERIEELEVELEAAKMAREMAEDKVNSYRKRFEELGRNVKTVEEIPGANVLKWTIKPQPWGTYAAYVKDLKPNMDVMRESLVSKIAKGLIENDIVQFIDKTGSDDDPFNVMSTLGAKLYVIPWDRVPHTGILEVRQIAAEMVEGIENEA